MPLDVNDLSLNQKEVYKAIYVYVYITYIKRCKDF